MLQDNYYNYWNMLRRTFLFSSLLGLHSHFWEWKTEYDNEWNQDTSLLKTQQSRVEASISIRPLG